MSKETNKMEIELIVSHDVKTGKTTTYDYRFKDIKNAVLRAQGGSGGGVKPPLTNEQIEELLPEADGTAEEVKRKVEYKPGLWADEVGIDDAWSKSLVIEIIRAVEKHHGIGKA